jgi:hypothetical protein
MTYFGVVLVGIALLLTILDMVLWRNAAPNGPAYASRHILLQVAVLLIGIALLCGVTAVIKL